MTALRLPVAWDPRLDLLILVGDGCGALATELRAEGQSRVVVVAPHPVADLPADVPRVASPDELLHPIVALTGPAPARMVVHQTTDPWAGAARRDAVIAAAREALQSRQAQRLTLERSGVTWARQGLTNLASVARFPAVTTLAGALPGRTAFLCAPGPSLSEALPHLRAHRDRCVVFALSHSLHALQGGGVTPDFVVVADAGNLERHFEGLDTQDVPALVTAVTCRSVLFEQPARHHFHFAGNGRTDDWLYGALNVDARLASGGSVACSATSLAIALGCTRVVFCGLDLAFPEGRYYAAETLDGDARVQEQQGRFFLRKEAGAKGSTYELPDGGLRFSADQPALRVPAVGGGQVGTSVPMRVYLSWFQALAAELAGRVTLVQTSRAGAYIAGCEHAPIQAEVARLSASDDGARAAVEAALEAAHARHDAPAAAERLEAYFGQLRTALPLVGELATDLDRLATRALLDRSLVATLQRGEEELRAALRPLLVLSLVAYGDLQRADEEARAGGGLRDDLRASQRVFRAVASASRLLQAPLAEGLRALAQVLPSGAGRPAA